MIAGKKVFIAVAVTLCIGGTIWWAMPRDETAHEASWHGAVVAAKQGNYELMHSDEIRQLLEEAPQKIVVIDVRQKEDYDAGHIAHAVNVPLHRNLLGRGGEKTRLAHALGPDKTRYAIFSGADLSDALSDLAARTAVELGYNQVFRHAKGFSDWKDAGLRVSKTASEQSDAGDSLLRKPVVFGWAMIGTLLTIFFGGVALNLTPCVYPLVPITVSYFGTRQGQTRVTLAAHGVLYVGGLAFTNSLLGVAASLTGGLMGSALQHPAVLVLVGIVLVVLATSLFGYWEFRLPSSVTTWASRSYAGFAGSLFMGMTLGLVAAPCMGPFVLGLLAWVAQMGDPLTGFLVFFSLSLGLGLPLFVLALVSGSLGRLPGSGEWMLWVRKFMGWVLVGMAAYFTGTLLPDPYELLLLAAVIGAASLHLGWIDGTQAGFRGFRVLRFSVGVAGLVWAGILVGSLSSSPAALSWRPYSDAVLAQARAEQRPVIIDFSASWCGVCRQMEREIFSNPEVIEVAQKGFITVKVDLTQAADKEKAQLVKRYNIRGVPTVIFLDAQGREQSSLRLMGSTLPKDFLSRMAQVK